MLLHNRQGSHFSLHCSHLPSLFISGRAALTKCDFKLLLLKFKLSSLVVFLPILYSLLYPTLYAHECQNIFIIFRSNIII